MGPLFPHESRPSVLLTTYYPTRSCGASAVRGVRVRGCGVPPRHYALANTPTTFEFDGGMCATGAIRAPAPTKRQ